MSAPGWYPDPSSPQGGYRYWDGTAWTGQTSSGSAGTTSPAAAPRKRTWIWFAVGLAVITALVLVLIFRPGSGLTGTPGDTNSSRPTGSQWNELEPTESPTLPEDPGNGETVECPRDSTEQRSQVDGDGRVHGGGLSFEGMSGRWDNGPVWIPWLYDNNSQTRGIAPGWMSNVSVGYAKQSEGFKTPKSAAEQMMACLTSSSLYLGFSGREVLRNEAFAIDGRNGWRVTSNVFVDNQGDIKGDVVDVIILDLGRRDQLSVYISCATIDHQENLGEVQRAFDSLRVD